MSNTVNPIGRIMNLVKLERSEIIAIYFHAVLNGLIQLSLPVGVQAIIGFVQGGAMSASLVILIALVVIGVLCSGMLQMAQMGLIEKVQQKIFVRYSFTLASRMPKLDMRAAESYYLPELMNRFFEIPTLQKGLSKLLLDIPIASIQILFGLLLLSFYHPAFIFFGLLLLVILWLILYYTGYSGLKSSLAESEYKYKVAAWLQEMARLAKTFKFSKGSELNMEKTDSHATGYLKARNHHFHVLRFQFKILVAFKVLITASMLIVGAILLVNQQLNIGQFIAAELVILTVINSVEKLIVNLDSVYDVLTSIEKIGKITDKPIEENGLYPMPILNDGISLEIKDLSFGYAEKDILIRNLSVVIPSGEKVCITGKEGLGKTTLLQLLCGMFDRFEGAILLNQLPIGNYKKSTFRAHTGIFFQGQDVFQGTIWENMSMGNKNITYQEIIGLMDIVGLKGFIATQKAGLDTPLKTEGETLPQSVVRKILLARALAGNPKLLLLDEPFLGLDEISARSLRDYLLRKMPNTTLIAISNDPDFVKECHQLIPFS